MTSKSWTTTSTFQCPSSCRQLGRHTDPITSAEEDCRSDGRRKTSKRNSEESLQRAGKRSRTSQSPSEACSQTFSGPSSGVTEASSASAFTGPPDSTGETQSLSGPSTEPVLVTGETKTSSKRESSSAESNEGLRKRSRETPSPTEDHIQTIRGSSTFTEDTGTPVSISTQDSWISKLASISIGISTVDSGKYTLTNDSISTGAEDRKSGKRKSEETEGPRKRSRKSPSPSDSSGGPSHQATTETSSRDKAGTSSSVNTGPTTSRDAFEDKYEEDELLGEGGFGSVFAGHRIDDNLPVAIKHIDQSNLEKTSILLEGEMRRVPLEVALLLKLKPAAAGTSTVVTLLDWYDLDYELILVLERPVPCVDLVDYLDLGFLQEHEAKTITQQMVDAIIEVHSRGVFHRDIKPDNILIETGSDVPRVRLIDFGCGTFLSERTYSRAQGTVDYTSPEWFLRRCYRAEPTTVWQLGVVLFWMLHGRLPFTSISDITFLDPDVNDDLSFDCHNFLLSCLEKSPEDRPTLEALKHHPWLM